MIERPILFSGPMVRAILEGRKTATRRIVEPQPPADCQAWAGWILDSTVGKDVGKASWHDQTGPLAFKTHHVRCPYGHPGDLLWVRETFRGAAGYDGQPPSQWGNKPIWYEADGEPSEEWWHLSVKSKPSIHMPRWASRINLEVTGIRVEKLKAITPADILLEGIRTSKGTVIGDICAHDPDELQFQFANLWENINGPGSWDANPWVFAVNFRRII